jgi:hypothetical protein
VAKRVDRSFSPRRPFGPLWRISSAAENTAKYGLQQDYRVGLIPSIASGRILMVRSSGIEKPFEIDAPNAAESPVPVPVGLQTSPPVLPLSEKRGPRLYLDPDAAVSPPGSRISPTASGSSPHASPTSLSPFKPRPRTAFLPPEAEVRQTDGAMQHKLAILAELGPAVPAPSTTSPTEGSQAVPARADLEELGSSMPRADGRARVETDAGRISGPLGQEDHAERTEEVLPPNYDPAWRYR